MELRKSLEKDLDSIMNIINQSKEYFKSQGIDQWQDGYPNEDTIKEDINNGYSHVLIKDNKIVATSAILFDKESTYENIYEGEWITNVEYAAIHRIAVDSNYKGFGLAGEIIKNIEKMCLDRELKSIKVDTHEDNKSMQKMLSKNGFKYCGVIYLEDNSKRVAFEKTL